jgi:hypothetical protein
LGKFIFQDELWQKLRDNALSVLTADPTALVAGVCEWGWPNCSNKQNSFLINQISAQEKI